MGGFGGWFRNFTARLGAGVRRFMEGRYGNDRLNMFILGAGLVLAGLTVLWLLLCNLTAKGVWKLGRLTLRGIKACFIRKKGA